MENSDYDLAMDYTNGTERIRRTVENYSPCSNSVTEGTDKNSITDSQTTRDSQEIVNNDYEEIKGSLSNPTTKDTNNTHLDASTNKINGKCFFTTVILLCLITVLVVAGLVPKVIHSH